MTKTIELSSLLGKRRGEILERWTQRIRGEHEDKDLSRGELQDHLPYFFDGVLAALHSGEPLEVTLSSASVAHESQRLRVGFDLAEVIREHEILTECILEEVEAVGGSLSIRALRRMQMLLNTGRTEAVRAYVEQRDAEVTREHSQHVGG